MNQRFLLALLLTGVVIILTPILFPGKPRPAAPVVAPTTAAPPPVAADTTPVRLPSANAAPGTQVRDTQRVATNAVDTAVFTTPLQRLRFSGVGGSLVGAELTNYRTLGPDSSIVELARPGEALLRFRVVMGADTLPIDRVALAIDSTSSPDGLVFRGSVRGVPTEVRWSFAPDTYRVKINSEEQNVGYIGRVSVATTGVPAGAYLLIDLPSGFRTAEADSSTDFQHLAYAYKPVSNGARLIRFGKLDPGEREIRTTPLSWAVAKSKYFMVAVLAPANDAAFAELQVTGAPRTWKHATSGRATVVTPLRNGSAEMEVYIGPQEWRRLVALGREFETSNPYGGWMQGMIQPFSTIVMRILLWMKDVLELNYGWTLIIFGVLVRVVLWPLNQSAMRASMKMQRMQPELAAVQKKYSQNPDKLREESMRIYREHGTSPFIMLSGCLPMLIPMPVLFALFFVFQNTIEFRGVSFWWMADISQKDPLYIVPVVMAVSMFVLSWIGMRNSPPNPQAKIMLYFLPGMMLVLLFNFAAGLNLYYAAQNLAALPQQWLIANERAKHAQKSSG